MSEDAATLPGSFWRPENRSWRSPHGKCTREYGGAAGPVQKDLTITETDASPGEFRGSTMRLHQFASMQFHVLLNSLFKVLFNFPSQYLFAIGLMPVFSLRWSLPPTLGCNLKQPDSGEALRDGGRQPRGLTPTMGEAPVKETRNVHHTPQSALPNTTFPATGKRQGIRCWAFPSSLAVTRGILVSFFSSA